jgi:hypothetical protein
VTRQASWCSWQHTGFWYLGPQFNSGWGCIFFYGYREMGKRKRAREIEGKAVVGRKRIPTGFGWREQARACSNQLATAMVASSLTLLHCRRTSSFSVRCLKVRSFTPVANGEHVLTAASLTASLAQWREEEKRGVWLKIPSTKAHLISIAVEVPSLRLPGLHKQQ